MYLGSRQDDLARGVHGLGGEGDPRGHSPSRDGHHDSVQTGDLLVQDEITNGYILSYIGLVAERVNYGAEYCTAKKPDPITCGLTEYGRVLNEYSIFQVGLLGMKI